MKNLNEVTASQSQKVKKPREHQLVENPFLTAQEVCDVLHICRTTLYNYSKDGLIPAYKIKRLALYRLSDVLAALSKVETLSVQ